MDNKQKSKKRRRFQCNSVTKKENIAGGKWVENWQKKIIIL